MSSINIISNDKIIEKFADCIIEEIQKGLNIDIKNEEYIIERFHAYLKELNVKEVLLSEEYLKSTS